MDDGYLIAELADLSGVEVRTIRHWVSNGLVPGPGRSGPGARHPASALERVLAVRTMRDVHRMGLAEIRAEFLASDPAKVAAYAAAAADRVGVPAPPAPAPSGSSAADYLAGLAGRVPATAPGRAAPPPAPSAPTGFRALEEALPKPPRGVGPGRPAPAEEMLCVPITPEVEFVVRGHLDPEARARVERCADLIRNVLLGATA